MKRERTKLPITVSLTKNMYSIVDKKFKNKSKYIEWLVYQELLKNSDNDELKNILI